MVNNVYDKLICVFVFAYPKSRFFHFEALIDNEIVNQMTLPSSERNFKYKYFTEEMIYTIFKNVFVILVQYDCVVGYKMFCILLIEIILSSLNDIRCHDC